MKTTPEGREQLRRDILLNAAEDAETARQAQLMRRIDYAVLSGLILLVLIVWVATGTGNVR